MNAIERSKAEIARLEGLIRYSREQIDFHAKNIEREQEKLDKLKHAADEDRAAWDRAIKECKRKGGIRAKALSPRALYVALGIYPERVQSYISGAVWFANMGNMPGYVYSATKGQISYPCAYFRTKKMRDRIKEEGVYECLASVNFRRMLRRETPLTFEQAQARDKAEGTKWRSK